MQEWKGMKRWQLLKQTEIVYPQTTYGNSVPLYPPYPVAPMYPNGFSQFPVYYHNNNQPPYPMYPRVCGKFFCFILLHGLINVVMTHNLHFCGSTMVYFLTMTTHIESNSCFVENH